MIDLAEVSFVGSGLVRPECVLATGSGDLYTADWRGGVAHIRPDGSQALYVGSSADLPEGARPNGIALDRDGSFLFANLGSEVGGVWRIDRSGQIRPVLTELEGKPIPPSNFVLRDRDERLWLTVSTRLTPRSLDYRRNAASGFVVVIDMRGARIVGDGLGYTNECLVDPARQWLYVNETYARRLSRFPLKSNGDLGTNEVVCTFGRGQYPDGMAMDMDGRIWITSVVSNQLLRVDPCNGAVEVMLDDGDPDHVDWVEQAYLADALDRQHMDTMRSRKLQNISSIAFGGRDLRTAYLGCLLGDSIAVLRLPATGVAPVHWH